MNTTIRLQSVKFTEARTYFIAVLFIVGNIVLPQLCHLLPQGGLRWLPIYFFTLVGAYRYGWRVGVLTALASPLLNSLLFGMPALQAVPGIMLKSVVLAVAAAFAAHKVRKVSMLALACAVIACQSVGIVGEWLMGYSWHDALQDVRIGLPGIMMQVVGGWLVLRCSGLFLRFDE